jgi:uncharacterized membrane protein YhaH (DUF805 family)
LRALAAVFEVPPETLLIQESNPSQQAFKAMHNGVLQSLDFTGLTSRSDFWWFVLGATIFLAFAKLLAIIVGQLPLQIAALMVLIPWLAACTRRLRDAGLSIWWQLICLVPVAGILLLLYLLTFESKSKQPS